MIDRLYQEARELLEANKDRIEAIAKALMKYETLDNSDIDRLMHGDTLSKPTVGDLLEREQRRAGTVIQPSDGKSEPDIQLGGGPLPAPG
jgi:cell division protease FtsH